MWKEPGYEDTSNLLVPLCTYHEMLVFTKKSGKVVLGCKKISSMESVHLLCPLDRSMCVKYPSENVRPKITMYINYILDVCI